MNNVDQNDGTATAVGLAKRRVGLALGSGSARGLAHIGVIRAPCCPEIHRRGSCSFPMVIIQQSAQARATGDLAICSVVIVPNRAKWPQGFHAEEIAGT